jgi:hypothetical protein
MKSLIKGYGREKKVGLHCSSVSHGDDEHISRNMDCEVEKLIKSIKSVAFSNNNEWINS